MFKEIRGHGLSSHGKSRWSSRRGRDRYYRENQSYTQEYARAVFEAHREWLKRDDVEFLSENFEGATYAEAKIPHGRFEDIDANFGISSTKLFWDA